jgi:hypothetical protein
MIDNKLILYLSLIFAVLADMVHGFYYIGTAVFFMLISLYIFIDDKFSFVKFVLLWLATWNLFKELFLDPLHFSILEMIIILLVIIARLFYKQKTY